MCVDMCVHTCSRLQEWLHLLCPAARRYKTEMCRHLRDRVPLHFLNGCRPWPNAPWAQAGKSSTSLAPPHPYITVPASSTVWETSSQSLNFLCGVPNTVASILRFVALKLFNNANKNEMRWFGILVSLFWVQSRGQEVMGTDDVWWWCTWLLFQQFINHLTEKWSRI